MPLHRQLAHRDRHAALTQVPLLLAANVPMLALTVFLSGVAISPTFITSFGLIERRVPAAQLTEGITWVMTGIGIGMAMGAFAAGWVVDAYGARNGSGFRSSWAQIAFAIVLAGQAVLGRGAALNADPQALPCPAESVWPESIRRHPVVPPTEFRCRQS
jgi:MFS family permease